MGEEGIEYSQINCKEEVFDYHVTFNPKFYTERARLRYEAETYARKKEQTKEVQPSKEQSTNLKDIHYENIEDSMDLNEDGDRNDWGLPAGQQRCFNQRTDCGRPGNQPGQTTER